MMFALELKKTKRTGFFPAFFAGALAASALPVINTAARPDSFIHQELPAFPVLLNANWSICAMLNSFLVIIGACILYHTEFSDRGIEKMHQLPVSRNQMFFCKGLLLFLGTGIMVLLENLFLLFCAWYWFPDPSGILSAAIQNVWYSLILMLPVILLMLLTASLCRNMWVSLGIGITLLFTAQMLISSDTVLVYFPFALPYQFLSSGELSGDAVCFLAAALAETLLFGALKLFLTKSRRYTL